MTNYTKLEEQGNEVDNLVKINSEEKKSIKFGINSNGDIVANLEIIQPLTKEQAIMCLKNKDTSPEHFRTKLQMIRYVCSLNNCPNFTSHICGKCKKRRCQYHIIGNICYDCKLNSACCFLN